MLHEDQCVLTWDQSVYLHVNEHRRMQTREGEQIDVLHLNSQQFFRIHLWTESKSKRGKVLPGCESGMRKDTLFCLQVTIGMRHGLKGEVTLTDPARYESSISETCSELGHYSTNTPKVMLQQRQGKPGSRKRDNFAYNANIMIPNSKLGLSKRC